MDAIRLENVSKRFKGFAIENLNMQVPKGLITGFIGPNGSGKSTVIRMILDAIQPDQGDIRIFGKQNDDMATKQNIGFVYDSLHMYGDLTLKKLKSFFAPLYPTWDEELYQQYVEKFELPERKKIKKFSKGMKMKTSLLLALSHRPELIIMDEPTSGLDPIFRRELLEHLQELMVNENQTIFFSTHITQDLDKIADYIIYIYKGKLQFQKTMDDIQSNFYLLKGAPDQLDNDLRNLLIGYKESPQGFTGLINGNWTLFAGLEHEFVLEPASLEDIMYYMTRKGIGA